MKYLTATVLAIGSMFSEGHAYTVSELYQEFDARLLTLDEKRFLQAALAFEGDYVGIIDGAWGSGSQSALEKNVAGWMTDYDGTVPSYAAAIIAGAAADVFKANGWEERYFAPLDMSLLVPSRSVRMGENSDTFFNMNHSASSLGYSMSRGGPDQVQRLHAYTLGEYGTGPEPYTVRKDGFWVTSVVTAKGMTLYTRSDYRRGAWSTIIVSAYGKDNGILAAVSGSIQRGAAPAIYFPKGKLSAGLAIIDAMVAEGEPGVGTPNDIAPPAVSPSGTTKDEPENHGGSGTGFVVSTAGDVLTNAHVVDGCQRISVDGIQMTLVATDANFDLALLRNAAFSGQPVASFSANPAMLNSDVTVAGYPLGGLLGGLNVTRGSVTSLKGLSGDASRMQISAPVQAGNSGGPVLNSDGLVVGVVVSKLDSQVVEEALGDTPQNVNFAIRGEIAKLFLVQNNIVPVSVMATEKPAPEILAQTAGAFTKFISCE